jgi:hypothetical protein
MEIFEVGDRVTWDLSMVLADLWEEKHGPGPFEIASIEEAKSYPDIFGFGDVGYSPHPQIVSVSKDGKVIPNFWSGNWFKKL